MDRSSQQLTLEEPGRRDRLVTGDAFLLLRGDTFALEAAVETALLVVDIELADTASPLPALLPPFLTVTRFDALEPAAAALAENMGIVDAAACPVRQGDPLICRMMATTVLLSVIRAWAANGCAPAGWPSLSKDPFLDRVVDAIHEQPGRDWTVERLATVGAMSRSAFAERFRLAVGRSPPTTSPRCASTPRSGCSRPGNPCRASRASSATPRTRVSAARSVAARA